MRWIVGWLCVCAATGRGREPDARIENHSYPTLCSELDNANIPVFCPGAAGYRIVATHPKYGPAPILEWGADWTDCAPDAPIWMLGIPDGRSEEFRADGFISGDEYFASDAPAAGLDEPVSEFPREMGGGISDLFIRFTADEAGDANIEARIGSRLTLGMADVPGPLEVRVFTEGREGWTDQGARIFDRGVLSGVWDLPDLVWREGTDANRIRLAAASADPAVPVPPVAQFDFLELRKRDQRGDNSSKPTVLYTNMDTRVETVLIDFWWLYPETMTVRVEGGETDPSAHYLRIRRRMPFSKEWNEIFVLYQDGNARLLPLPPVWRKSIPHGASILLGPSGDAARPVARIREIHVDPLDLSLDLVYADGSGAHVEMRADREAHVLDVTDLTYDTTMNSLTRLRSMWVRDGKSDLDRVRSRDGEFPLLGAWTGLSGAWWQFYRETPSYHNTDCPDVRIEILDDRFSAFMCEAEACETLTGGAVAASETARYSEAIAFGSAGGAAVYPFRLESALDTASVRFRFADADPGTAERPGTELRVSLDSAVTGETYTVCTGGAGEFEWTPAVPLGRIEAGEHTLRIAVGAGPGAVVLDAWDLISQPARELERIPLAAAQGESAGETVLGGRVEVAEALDGAVLRLGHPDEESSAEIRFVLDAGAEPVYLRVRVGGEAGPHRVTVRVDGEPRAVFPVTDTAGGFRETAELYLGALEAGEHDLRFVVEPGAGSVDLDSFEVYTRQAPLESEKNVMRAELEP
jgi:hypothetical protein